MNYSKGISWIDDCRIPFTDEGDIPNDMDKTQLTNNRTFIESGGYKPFLYRQNTQGRFPANLLCSDDVLNDGSISKSREKYPNENLLPMDYYGGLKKEYPTNTKQEKDGFTDKGTNSRYYDIDKWFDKIIHELL